LSYYVYNNDEVRLTSKNIYTEHLLNSNMNY